MASGEMRSRFRGRLSYLGQVGAFVEVDMDHKSHACGVHALMRIRAYRALAVRSDT